jgi:hypothetical protein
MTYHTQHNDIRGILYALYVLRRRCVVNIPSFRDYLGLGWVCGTMEVGMHYFSTSAGGGDGGNVDCFGEMFA